MPIRFGTAAAKLRGFLRAYLGQTLVYSGYTKCNYISSNKTAWLDTDYVPNTNSKIEAKWRKADTTTGYVAGVTNSANTQSVTEYTTSTSANWRFGNRAVSITTSANVDHITVQDKTGVTFDGTKSVYSTVSTFTSPGSIYLFANHTNGTGVNTSSYWLNGRVYYFKVYENNELVVDMIPVRRDSDNVYGMYDRVRKQFFPSNSGTDFSGG